MYCSVDESHGTVSTESRGDRVVAVYTPSWPNVEQLMYHAAQGALEGTDEPWWLTPEAVCLCLLRGEIQPTDDPLPTSEGAPLGSAVYVVHGSFCRSAGNWRALAVSFVTLWGVYTVELYEEVRVAVPEGKRLSLTPLAPAQVDPLYLRLDFSNLRSLEPLDQGDLRSGFPHARLLCAFPPGAGAGLAVRRQYTVWQAMVSRGLGPAPDRPFCCAGCRGLYRERRSRCLWPRGSDLLGRLFRTACVPHAVKLCDLSLLQVTDMLLAELQADESGWPSLREVPGLCVDKAVMLKDVFLCQQPTDTPVWHFYFLTTRGGCTVTISRRACEEEASAAQARSSRGPFAGPEHARLLRQLVTVGDRALRRQLWTAGYGRPWVSHWMVARSRAGAWRTLVSRQIALLCRAASISRHVSAPLPPPQAYDPGWCVWSGCPGSSPIEARWEDWHGSSTAAQPEDAAVYRQMSRLLLVAELSVTRVACVACAQSGVADDPDHHFCGQTYGPGTADELRRTLVRWADDESGGWSTLCHEAVLAAGLSPAEPRHLLSARAFMNEALPDLFVADRERAPQLLALFSGGPEPVHQSPRSWPVPRCWGRRRHYDWLGVDGRYMCLTAEPY